MLRVTIPAIEQWDERLQEFVSTKECTLQLEHSLLSLAKWESKWNKAFLSKEPKTNEESLDYIRCMTISKGIDPSVYNYIPNNIIQQINDYIEAPMTATSFSEDKSGKKSREIVTAEIIYYWMIALNIPPEYDKWHLNRLLTLVRVCNIKNTPPKKRSKRDIMSSNAALNAARRAQYNTKG